MYKKYFLSGTHDSLGERKILLIRASSEQDQDTRKADKSKAPPSPKKTETAHRKTKVAEKGEKIKKDLDKIIDEIDDVLEENAEEFIRSYVQRGGE